MASPVSYSIPNLLQGVSQQPDALRDPSQGEIQANGMSSLTDGLRKREGSACIARVSQTSLGDVAFHSILRDADEKYLVVVGAGGVRVFDLAGAEKVVNAPYGYSYLSTVVSAEADVRCATIADFTFVSNTRRTPAMATAVAPAVARPAVHEALIWVKGANYGQSYQANVNGTSATVETPVAPVVVNGSTTTENRISTATIAENLRVALAGASGVTITRNKSVLHLTSASPITLAANDARANADITAIANSVQAFTDLPTIAPRGYQVAITGDPGNKFDGYYVRFEPRSGAGNFGEGAWEETVAPGVEYQIDAATMPHLLVRQPSGQFYFGPANGTTQGGVTIPSWGQRAAGDYDSAPDPSFIGNPIQDVFIYKNRLGFLADENVILSRARDFFQFFPETVTGILDSDPIDLTASNSRVSVLRYAVPYQDELIIFSDQIQFRFNAAETVLTPETAVITVLTQYEIDRRCRPIAVAGTIVFCQANGEWSNFREFSVRGAGTALVADASDLTVYLPTYIPNGVVRLAANDTGNVWFAISRRAGYENRIYVHKFFTRNSERAQSSWSHWQFGGVDRVLQILCVEEVLYCLMARGAEVWLEKIPVADRATVGQTCLCPLLLDRKITTTLATPALLRVASGVYDVVTKRTTWTLPYAIRATTEAWSMYGAGQNGGVLLGQASSGNTITADGNWALKDIAFGEAYEFRYRFTRFKLYREIGGGKVAANVERTQVRQLKLRYRGTGFFEAVVLAERRPEAVYAFSGTILGVRNSQLGSALGTGDDLEDARFSEGVFTVPIHGRGESTIVELRNATAKPCQFSGCDWVGTITGRARSLQ